MHIELKNVKIYDGLSGETIAFSASLYINNTLAGTCSNAGHGGENKVESYIRDQKVYNERLKLIKEAEVYCKTLPLKKVILQEIGDLPMDLEFFISLEVGKHAEQLDIKKFKKKMEKDMLKGVLIGTDTSYSLIKYKSPFTTLISLPGAAEWLSGQLVAIRDEMKEGDKFLNTNFPAGTVIPELPVPVLK